MKSIINQRVSVLNVSIIGKEKLKK